MMKLCGHRASVANITDVSIQRSSDSAFFIYYKMEGNEMGLLQKGDEGVMLILRFKPSPGRDQIVVRPFFRNSSAEYYWNTNPQLLFRSGLGRR